VLLTTYPLISNNRQNCSSL